VVSGTPYFNRPDVLTPSLPPEKLIELLTPHVGSELARHLQRLNESAITAVEGGDFKLHVELGEQIAAAARGLTDIEAAGHYFAAEGYRLQAALEVDGAKLVLLLKRAAEEYELSLEINPDNARAMRGLARVHEVQGDYSGALRMFRRAEGLALLHLSSQADGSLTLHLSHEILRITRHYIHCILDIMATNPQSTWHQENKKRELEGYVIECENLHREHMLLFKGRERWWRIEWFMALIFFGEAWGQLGSVSKKTKCLLDALLIRHRMIDMNRSLKEVERDNLKWWTSVALLRPRISHCAGVMELAQTLEKGSTTEVMRKISDILRPYLPAWQQE
jgi:tetratricopeptide (TPR) repeat protein